MRVTSNNIVSLRNEPESSTITGKVLDKVVGAYVGTLFKLDMLNYKLTQEKENSTTSRAKYAAFAPFYHTLVGGLSGAAIGVLQTIEQSAAKQTVAQISGSVRGAAAGFLHGLEEARDTLT